MSRVQVVMSWSGGKDSSLALHALQQDDTCEVVALLTSVTRGYDRISIHGVRRVLLEQQAQAIGLPLFEATLEPQSSNAAYEAAFLETVQRVLRAFPGVQQIAFGDLYLEDVRAYRDRLVSATSLSASYPLWGRNTGALARDFIGAGFRATLVCVDTTQLSAAFAGRSYDSALLEELPPGVDPCGEGGEFHTFVSAGPIFTHPIPMEIGEVVLRDERFAYCDLLPLALAGDMRT